MPLVTEKFEIPYANLRLQRPPCWLHIEEFLFNTWGAVKRYFWDCTKCAGKKNLALPSYFFLLCGIKPFLVLTLDYRKTEVENNWAFFADLHLLLIECGLDLQMQTNLQQENAPVPIAKPEPAWFPWRSGWGHSPCLAAVWIFHSCVTRDREGATNRMIFMMKRKWTSRNNDFLSYQLQNSIT